MFISLISLNAIRFMRLATPLVAILNYLRKDLQQHLKRAVAQVVRK